MLENLFANGRNKMIIYFAVLAWFGVVLAFLFNGYPYTALFIAALPFITGVSVSSGD